MSNMAEYDRAMADYDMLETVQILIDEDELIMKYPRSDEPSVIMNRLTRDKERIKKLSTDLAQCEFNQAMTNNTMVL